MQGERTRDRVRDDLVAWGRSEDAVRAIVLVGSRASDPDRVDELSDHDVVVFHSHPAELAGDAGWVERFGDVLVELPQPRRVSGPSVGTRLVQYRDGTKIDFNLAPVEELERAVRGGTLPEGLDAGYEVLLDKDGTAAGLPEPSGRVHVPDRPTAGELVAHTEEFWWETLYVARSLVRGEILFARYSAEVVIRYRLLVPALEWYVQLERGWSQPVGPHGKGLAELLPGEVRRQLEATMPGADPAANWEALFTTTGLFRDVVRPVAGELGLDYPEELDRDVSERLRELRARWEEGRGWTPDA